MKLKRLELIGFKSFAQKTTLEFLPGIIGIVGPNGAGKSNITDAIRWILGERESSHLRSAKIEDLIFAGTPSRPAMSLAQVSMHFDNSAGVLPIDYSDVAVSRKIGRDGASEYFLNDSRVRLRDVTDLFAKARLGVRGIAVINQGASDVFLRAKPDERREMIEEMLGLKEFRLKKNDAGNKLENTDINLSKGKALLEEIQPHLRFLRRQVTRWNKRSEIESELKTLEKDYFLRQLKSIHQNLSELVGRKAQIEVAYAEKKKAFGERRASLEKTEGNQPELLEKLNALRIQKNDIETQKSNLVRALGRLEGRLEATTETAAVNNVPSFNSGEAKRLIADLRAGIEQLINLSDVSLMREAARALVTRIDGFSRPVPTVETPVERVNPNIEAIELEKGKLVGSITELEKRLAGVISSEAAISAEASETNKTFQVAFKSSEEASDEVRRIERSIDEIRLDEERFSVHLEDLKTRTREAEWDFAHLEASIADYQFLPDDPGQEDRIFKLRREIGAIGDIDQALLNEANEVEGRSNFLTTQITDLEAAKIDLEKLIVDLDGQIHEIFSGSLKKINEEFQNFFRLMFGGGKAKLVLDLNRPKRKASVLEMIGSEVGGAEEEGAEPVEEEKVDESEAGIEIIIDLPRKKIKSVEMLSGGERSLISIAALFALVAVSPPPFLVLDEVDAALDEMNARRFSNLLKDLSKKTQFIVVTHNRVTMEATDALYGVTMGEDGISKILSLKLEESGPAPATV